MLRVLTIMVAACTLAQASDTATRIEYVGGTVAGISGHASGSIDVHDDASLLLRIKNKSISVAWRDVNNLEYGLHVNRRYLEAVLISPLFLVAKRRSHFLTIGYVDADGHQQAIVLEVGKGDIRQLLVSLEARSGRRVEFQDEEARKAGKG